MNRHLFPILLTIASFTTAQAQSTQQDIVRQIREIYAEAKQSIAQNGNNGMPPLDIHITISNPSDAGDDFLDDNTELTFYFTKYRIDTSLGYPDASSCYFVIENRNSNGHHIYRETLYHPNEGYLLFCYMKGETDAGFTVETRYYYDADGQLVDQKHRVAGHDAVPGTHSWNDEVSEKERANRYLQIFDMLMNDRTADLPPASETTTTAKAERIKMIRSTYAQAKQKIDADTKADYPRNIQIIIRDLPGETPATTSLQFYFQPLQQDGESGNHCYFIAEQRTQDGMEPERYKEYLFGPDNHQLIFSYSRIKKNNETNEWRYYYDAGGTCFDVISKSAENDKGQSSRLAAQRYLKLFNTILK